MHQFGKITGISPLAQVTSIQLSLNLVKLSIANISSKRIMRNFEKMNVEEKQSMMNHTKYERIKKP